MFSLKLNGCLECFFHGQSGLRQGDVMAMEVLSSCLNNKSRGGDFKFHWRTKEVCLNHIIFADDVFLFSYGNVTSVSALMSGVHQFSSFFWLIPNRAKSQCFLGNIRSEVVDSIIAITGFQRGSFPICYLGLPLITSRLLVRDCHQLVNKISARIQTWTARFLNFAGRL